MGRGGPGVNGSEPPESAPVDPQTLSDRDLLAALLTGSRSRAQTLPDRDFAGDLLEQYGDLLGLAKTRGRFMPSQDREILFPLTVAFEEYGPADRGAELRDPRGARRHRAGRGC